MLVSAKEMLEKARDGKYAVGQFNINNLEWTKAILLTAQEMNSPVILGVSCGAGKYMTGFKTVASMVSSMIDDLKITVPVALHLDHGTYEACYDCIDAGFSSIMFDGSHYPIEENIEKTKELGFNNYPVVDKNNVCKGLIRITDISKKNRKKVILVDHNESLQSADGLEEANILEVIDHHKIGDISTNNPINFRNMAVGSTNTIIYHLFMENRVDIPKVIASLMLAGIISDTLSLTSPTTTDEDVKVVESLEKISGLSHNEFALEIFNSSVNLDKKTEYDLITADIKTFQNAGRLFKVSQVTTMNATKMLLRKNPCKKSVNLS